MKSLTVISLIVVLKVLGDVCLSHGMQEVGEVHPLQPLALLEVGLRMLTNPWFELAMISLLTYTILYMVALSWLDLSYMLPITTSTYVITALFAWLLLDEKITATRWAGTLTIAIGVLLVSLSDAAKHGLPVWTRRKSRRKTLKASIPPEKSAHHPDNTSEGEK